SVPIANNSCPRRASSTGSPPACPRSMAPSAISVSGTPCEKSGLSGFFSSLMKPPRAAPRACDGLVVAAVAIEHSGHLDTVQELVLRESFPGARFSSTPLGLIVAGRNTVHEPLAPRWKALHAIGPSGRLFCASTGCAHAPSNSDAAATAD